MTFIEIWNKAYSIFTDGTISEAANYNRTKRFLEERVKAGDIDKAVAGQIFVDVRETAGF